MSLKKKPARRPSVPPMLAQAIASARARKDAREALEALAPTDAEISAVYASLPPAPLTPLELLEKDAEVFRRKQADYSPNGAAPKTFTLLLDAFENFRFSAWYASRVCKGLPEDDPRRAAAILEGVKISRRMTVGLAGTASNETIDDTGSDGRNYSAILDALNLEARAK